MYALSNENKGNWTGEKLVHREREKTRETREKREYIYISMSENIEPHIGHIDEERKELKKISVNRETSVDANIFKVSY
jgi:hypothetical protein